ncbi:MAG: hypothetical protein M3296_09615, partial [Actinomycetota bacterium]|nr:hypothetical protein [Actinomycetota bacterium]
MDGGKRRLGAIALRGSRAPAGHPANPPVHRGPHSGALIATRVMTSRLLALTAALCLGLAAASLVLPYEPAYDVWAWLVWGRELAGLEVHLATGPSWKPLPVLVAMPLAATGNAAPMLWLVLVRAAWLLALALAADLAYRLTAD